MTIGNLTDLVFMTLVPPFAANYLWGFMGRNSQWPRKSPPVTSDLVAKLTPRLFRYFAERDAKRVCYPLAIIRICL